MQDQAFLGPESGLAVPAEDGGVDLYVATQWLHVDQRQICLALGMPPDKVRLTPGRRRRRVRRPRGPVGARARVPARAAHRPAGEDVLRPGGVLLRPRAPAPGVDDLRVRRRARRHPRLRPGPHRARRRGVRLVDRRGRGQRRHPGPRPVPDPERDGRRLRRVHQQPAVRGDARVRLRADRVRLRGADGRAGRAGRAGPGRDPAAQRHARGRHATSPGRSSTPPPRSPSCCRSCATCRCRRARRTTSDIRVAARGGLQHHPRRGRRPRRRLRGDLQERRLLRGLRRLLDRAGPAGDDRRRGRGDGAHRGRGGRPGPDHRAAADLPHRARRGAGRRPPDEHRRRIRRVDLGVPADLRDRWRGEGGVRGGARRRPGAGGPVPRAGPPPSSGWTARRSSGSRARC